MSMGRRHLPTAFDKFLSIEIFSRCGLILAYLFISVGCLAEEYGAVSGNVICNDTRSPARFAIVRLVETAYDAHGNGHAVSTQTGPDGTFHFDKVPVGQYVVDVSFKGYVQPLRGAVIEEVASGFRNKLSDYETMPRLSVYPSKLAETHVSLSRGASISGHVAYDEGAPAAGLKVTAIPFSPPNSSQGQTHVGLIAGDTDDTGAFRIAGLTRGRYLLRVDMPEGFAGQMMFPFFWGDTFDSSSAKPITIETTEDLADVGIRVPISNLHRISGSLQGTRGGATVTLRSANPQGSQATLSAMCDQKGNFIFPAIPDGQYLLLPNLVSERPGSKIIPVLMSGHDVAIDPISSPQDAREKSSQ